MKDLEWYHHAIFLLITVLLSALLSVAIAGNIGVAYNEETSRVTYQELKRADNYKLYINSDINNPDTTRVSNVTRLVGHAGNKQFHASTMGTFATGYNATMVGVGYDFLSKQLLGFDVGRRNNGDTAVFGYWGVGNSSIVSDGFIDTDGKTYVMRGTLLRPLTKRIQAGYELEMKNDMPLHSIRLKVNL